VPKSSIIITTHNRPGMLPRAVQSARNAGTDVEVIVVDDASQDETAEVCGGLSGIRYLRTDTNKKVAGARNLGIAASRGEFISFLDDDDVRLPQSLDLQIEALQSSASGFVYGQALIADHIGASDGSFSPAACPQGDVFWKLLERNFIPCGSVVFRKSSIERVGMLDESIAGIDDWDLWVRLAEAANAVAVEQPVVIWRAPTPTSGQGSSLTLDLIALSISRMRQHWLRLPRASNASQTERREAWRRFSDNISEHLVWETFNGLAAGDLRRAWKSARSVLRLHPAGPLGVGRRWARASTLKSLMTSGFTESELADTKQHFKRVRSGLMTK